MTRRALLAALLLILVIGGTMNAKSLWSGGVEWGTASTARAAAFWQDDGATPSGRLFPDVAIAGRLLTASCQSASWSLGSPGILDDLGPNTASLSFVGQVTAAPNATVVISTGLGVQWSGRVDTSTQTRDTAGDWWTTVTATDMVGVLGAAVLSNVNVTGGTMAVLAESLAASAGLSMDMVDLSVSGLPTMSGWGAIGASPTFTGTVLDYVNILARTSNAVARLARDGRVSVVIREALAGAPTALPLTGVDAPVTWSLVYSLDVDVNRWVLTTESPNYVLDTSDAADVAAYGERPYELTTYMDDDHPQFDDWVTYGGSQRPTMSAELVVASWAQDHLILLEPLQWVSESGTDWQVMSVQHDVTPGEWRVSITGDNLLDLL
jgi:hypothetical protein